MIVTTKKVLAYLFRNKQWILSDKQTLRSMLQASKTSMKRPSDLAKQTQLNIVNRILQSHKNIQQINVLSQYIVSLRHERFMSKQTLDTIQKWIQAIWQNLNNFNHLSASCFLVQQGRYALFDRFYNQSQSFHKQFKSNYLQQLIYQYCKCIVNKKIYTNNRLIQKALPKSLQKWKKQQYLISQTNKKQQIIRNETKKQRSNLQIQVQALLVTLNYPFQRQVNICGFMVDFLVQNIKKQQVGQKHIQSQTPKKFIIQVMGSHHYTVQHNLFGKDIMRALIIEQVYPVAMVHANDINPLKGVQNRMNYIQELIQQANCRIDIQNRRETILKQYNNYKSNLRKL